tara:strand:- start:309 stop:572 length:264 start_codon:yes stop_codon:yes gene_type:complete
MDIEKINEIKEEIEKMDKNSHQEVFNILENEQIPYNKNMNGIFINLSIVNKEVIQKLENFINYKKKQKKILNKDEEIKEQYKKEFFN